MVWKLGKHQRRKQRCQDLGWKVHDHAQSFVLRSYTMHDCVTNTFLLVSSSVRSKQLLCFVHSQGQKREEKHTTKKFVGFHNHFSPLLTMVQTFASYALIFILYSRKSNTFTRTFLKEAFGKNEHLKPLFAAF